MEWYRRDSGDTGEKEVVQQRNRKESKRNGLGDAEVKEGEKLVQHREGTEEEKRARKVFGVGQMEKRVVVEKKT